MTLPAAIAPPGNEGILPSARRCRLMILPAAIAALTGILLMSCTGVGGEKSVCIHARKILPFPAQRGQFRLLLPTAHRQFRSD